MVPQVAGGERLLDEQQVERVELGQVVGVVEGVGGIGVDLEAEVVPKRSRTAATRSTSRPGSIFNLMRT